MRYRTRGIQITYEFSTSPLQLQQVAPSFRSPRRISITVAHHTYNRLIEQSDREGRSLSNLAAYLLELATGGRSAQ